MRPTLARASSAASGLRFCGMIDEPVVNLSESRTKPNCGVIHSTISSARRERCIAAMAAAASVSSAKSRSETASSELAVGRSKPSASAVRVPVDRKRGAGQRRGTQRALVEPRACVGKPPAIARQHLHVGEQMMAEGDGLRRLQMREPRHDGAAVGFRLARERELQCRQRGIGAVDPRAHVELEIGRHLVVAGARRVQSRAPARRSAPSSRLSTFMCTSSSAREKVNSPFSISASTRSRPAAILRASSLVMMPCWASMAACALDARDVVGGQRLVEADGGVYLLHDLGRRHGEAASPHLVGGFVGHQINLNVQRARMSKAAPSQDPRRRAAVTLGAAALAAALGFAAVYVTLGRPDNASPPVSPQGKTAVAPPPQAAPSLPSGPGSNP